MRFSVLAMLSLIVLIDLMLAAAANAQVIRRPADAAAPGAPYAGSAATGGSGVVFAAENGMEGPSYAYGYALNVPADGNWRWIEARCYGARSGQVCVDGHWVRRSPGRCEEVSGHTVRRGGYIRVVPGGPVNTCRQ